MRYTRRKLRRMTKRSHKGKRKTRNRRKGGQRNWLGNLPNNNSNSNNNSSNSNSNSSNNNSNNNANNNNSRPRRAYWNEQRLDDELSKFIRSNDYDGLKEFLENNEDIDLNNRINYVGFSPLIQAVKISSLPIVELLVEYGSDIKKPFYGFTALSHAKHRADVHGDNDIFNYLMEKCGPNCTFRELPANIFSNNYVNSNNNNNNGWENNNANNNANNNNANKNANKNNNANNNTNESRNINNSKNLGQCYDPAMANNSANATEFIKESKNNILLVLSKKSVCLNRANIKKFTKMFYECREAKGTIGDDNVITDVKYGKLMPYNQLISEDELKKFQNKEHVIFKLKEDRKGKAFVSKDVRNSRDSYISADHCQEGSGGTIYTVEGYTLEDGMDFLGK
jgi:hypothetical protein